MNWYNSYKQANKDDEKMEEIMFQSDWISVRRLTDPEHDIEGYDYLHEDRCDGKIVALLPFRRTDDGIEYLLRSEFTPPWGYDNLVSSITGGVEGDNPDETAVMELHEEAGYKVDASDLISLGTSKGVKSADTDYYLYSADLTDKEETEATGDGSKLEAKAHCFWSKDISEAMDPHVYTLHYKLNKYLKD